MRIDLENRCRNHKKVTRKRCKESCRIKYDYSSKKFLVPKFVKGHNHNLFDASHGQLLRSHIQVLDANVALAKK